MLSPSWHYRDRKNDERRNSLYFLVVCNLTMDMDKMDSRLASPTLVRYRHSSRFGKVGLSCLVEEHLILLHLPLRIMVQLPRVQLLCFPLRHRRRLIMLSRPLRVLVMHLRRNPLLVIVALVLTQTMALSSLPYRRCRTHYLLRYLLRLVWLYLHPCLLLFLCLHLTI